MYRIDDKELRMVGEHYSTFEEFFQVNNARDLNAAYWDVGDRQADIPREFRGGEKCAWDETALYVRYGNDCFDEEFAALRAESMKQVDAWLAKREPSKMRLDVVALIDYITLQLPRGQLHRHV